MALGVRWRGRSPDPALSVHEKTRAHGSATPDRKPAMSIPAQTQVTPAVRHAPRDRRVGPDLATAHARLARAAWQCLVLGSLAFAASRALAGTAASSSDGAIWLVLAPMVSLLALYRHRILAPWVRQARSAPARRSGPVARGLQSRLPRRQASRLRRAA